LISVENGLKLVPAGEISRKTFKLEENQVFMFDVFCRFKILQNELLEGGSKPIFSAYASKSVKFHVAREERVQDLLNGNYFEILQGSEKEKYFQSDLETLFLFITKGNRHFFFNKKSCQLFFELTGLEDSTYLLLDICL